MNTFIDFYITACMFSYVMLGSEFSSYRPGVPVSILAEPCNVAIPKFELDVECSSTGFSRYGFKAGLTYLP